MYNNLKKLEQTRKLKLTSVQILKSDSVYHNSD